MDNKIMLNRESSTSLVNAQPHKEGDQTQRTANCQRRGGTINQKVFFATFMAAGVIGLALSLMYDVKSMQAVSVVAMCIGIFYPTAKRA
ncbi:hypothetical protein Q3R63_004420 [Salmonella enterica]|nr:hypothetical protein [Salmonella enterica]ELM1533885.1 hypothetical protein [Salmonella enterica]